MLQYFSDFLSKYFIEAQAALDRRRHMRRVIAKKFARTEKCALNIARYQIPK